MTIKAIYLLLPFGCWFSMGCGHSQPSNSAPLPQDTIVISDDNLHAALVSDVLTLTEQDSEWNVEVEPRQNLHYPSKLDTSICFHEQPDSICVLISFSHRFLTALRFTPGTKKVDALRIKDRLPAHVQHRMSMCSGCLLELSTSEGFNPFYISIRQGVVESISYRQTYLD